jgi:hypothetical protein
MKSFTHVAKSTVGRYERLQFVDDLLLLNNQNAAINITGFKDKDRNGD